MREATVPAIQIDRQVQVATVRLCNPGKLNAISYAMWIDLAARMKELSADPRLRCIVIRGDGSEAFAADGDIEEFLTRRHTPEAAYHYHEEAVAPALAAIAECPFPTLAMIHGACIGGGLEIACCCDLRIAGAAAKFGAPINRLGFPMYPGEMLRVLTVASPTVVAEILLEGRVFGAAEALAKGLVTRVVDDGELAAETAATVHRICQGAPLVARWHKQSLRRLADSTPLTRDEKIAAFAFLASDDYAEGISAFVAKRKPDFNGR